MQIYIFYICALNSPTKKLLYFLLRRFRSRSSCIPVEPNRMNGELFGLGLRLLLARDGELGARRVELHVLLREQRLKRGELSVEQLGLRVLVARGGAEELGRAKDQVARLGGEIAAMSNQMTAAADADGEQEALLKGRCAELESRCQDAEEALTAAEGEMARLSEDLLACQQREESASRGLADALADGERNAARAAEEERRKGAAALEAVSAAQVGAAGGRGGHRRYRINPSRRRGRPPRRHAGCGH